MSANARRFSKSKDDQRLLDNPKRRDRSRKPLVMCRLPGAGRAVVGRVPVVGEIMWGIVERYTLDAHPILYVGQAWESLPCSIIEIKEKDVLVTCGVPEEFETKHDRPPPSGVYLFLVPRVDNQAIEDERSEDDPYRNSQWNTRS